MAEPILAINRKYGFAAGLKSLIVTLVLFRLVNNKLCSKYPRYAMASRSIATSVNSMTFCILFNIHNPLTTINKYSIPCLKSCGSVSASYNGRNTKFSCHNGGMG